MTDSEDRVEPRNVTMYPRHWAMVDSFAKDMGYPSSSSALRRILDEWCDLKGKQLIDTRALYTAEANA